jgi:hypothetical protein
MNSVLNLTVVVKILFYLCQCSSKKKTSVQGLDSLSELFMGQVLFKALHIQQTHLTLMKQWCRYQIVTPLLMKSLRCRQILQWNQDQDLYILVLESTQELCCIIRLHLNFSFPTSYLSLTKCHIHSSPTAHLPVSPLWYSSNSIFTPSLGLHNALLLKPPKQSNSINV